MVGETLALSFEYNGVYPNMQDSTSDTHDLNRRQMHSGQKDVSPPPDGGTWHQLHEQEKLKQVTKTEEYEKPKGLISKAEPMGSQEGTNITILKE